MDIDWTFQLTEQLDWHWRTALRPRLEGITDQEYLWEPVAGGWSIRRRSQSTAQNAVGTGEYTFEFAYPEPDPGLVTTIAWRLAHIIVGCFAARNADHFGGPEAGWRTFAYAGTAKEALRQLDEAYARWITGARALGAEGLARPCGPAEGPYAQEPMAALLLHINREVIHHGAEIALLRDLYRDTTR
jgi:DinB superfamily